MDDKLQQLMEATDKRDTAYARILELERLLEIEQKEWRKHIDEITELHAEGI